MKTLQSRFAYEAMLDAYSRAPSLEELREPSPYDDEQHGRVGAFDMNLPSGQACDINQNGLQTRVRFIPFEEKCIEAPCKPGQCGAGGPAVMVEAKASVAIYGVGLFIDPTVATFMRVGMIQAGTWLLTAGCGGFGPASLFACCEIDEDQFLTMLIAAGVGFCMTVKLVGGGNVCFAAWLKAISCSVC